MNPMLHLKRFRRTIWFIILVMLGSPPLAIGGGFFEHDGVAIKGYDPVAYIIKQQALKGSPGYASEYMGSTFHFSSADNREAFEQQPQRFAPQYGGYCAFGVVKGYKASIDPSAFTIVEGKLYLNYSQSVMKQWRVDIPGNIQKGDRNWPEVAATEKVYQ